LTNIIYKIKLMNERAFLLFSQKILINGHPVHLRIINTSSEIIIIINISNSFKKKKIKINFHSKANFNM
jgi:hypothetical protein